MRFEPAQYHDANGTEDALIESDGRHLVLTVRGVKFEGTSFDTFALVQEESNLHHPSVSTFTFQKYGGLSSHSLQFCIPIPIQVDGETEYSQLVVRKGDAFVAEADKANLQDDDFELELIWRDVAYKTKGDFEDAFMKIKSLLPQNTQMKCCFNCAFSDYSPSGNDRFGNMMCFRDNKDAYSKVHSKQDLFEIWRTMTEYVQETYLCPEFKVRKPDTGYRG